MTVPPVVYLDHAATSWPKPPGVVEAYVDFIKNVCGSPGRGAHRGALEAGRRVEETRREIARFFGAPDPQKVIITPSCTHALNLAIRGLLRSGDHAIATEMDHNAALRPLAALEREGVELTIVTADAGGFVDPAAVRAAIRKNTRLITVSHASNVLGTIQDVAAIAAIARRAGVLLLVDAAQSAGVIPMDSLQMGLDLVAIPSHKSLLGLPGCGALIVSTEREIPLAPLHRGGTGLDSTCLLPEVTWPADFEAGTANAPGAAAWGAAIRYIVKSGVDNILDRERELLMIFEERLIKIPGVHLYGSRDARRRVGVVAISIDGWSPHDAAAALDSSFGVAARAGVACAPRVARAIGAPADGFVRFSLGYNTTLGDVDAASRAVAALADANNA